MSSWNSFCYVWFPQKGPSNECPCVNNQPLAKNYDLKISKVLNCMFFDGLCSCQFSNTRVLLFLCFSLSSHPYKCEKKIFLVWCFLGNEKIECQFFLSFGTNEKSLIQDGSLEWIVCMAWICHLIVVY